MNPDPCTCILQSHGFELYLQNEKPLVIHRYSKRSKDEKGKPVVEKFVEHLDLDSEHWPDTATAADVRKEMRQALVDLREWNAAMKGA